MRLAPNTICTLFVVALAASAVLTGCASDTLHPKSAPPESAGLPRFHKQRFI
jgi:outer membrane biogenesis lipoprotein LolB